MSKVKIGFSPGLLVLALIAGAYVSGLLTPLPLKLSNVPLPWNTCWRYVHALDLPQVAAYAGKIKATGYIGFGVLLLLWAILTIVILKTRAAAFHGDARFAGRADLVKAGLLKKTPEVTPGILLLALKPSQHPDAFFPMAVTVKETTS